MRRDACGQAMNFETTATRVLLCGQLLLLLMRALKRGTKGATHTHTHPDTPHVPELRKPTDLIKWPTATYFTAASAIMCALRTWKRPQFNLMVMLCPIAVTLKSLNH